MSIYLAGQNPDYVPPAPSSAPARTALPKGSPRCERCGAQFARRKYGGHLQTYCGLTCSVEARRELAAARRARRGMARQCLECAATIPWTPGGGGQRLVCSPACVRERAMRKQREQRAAAVERSETTVPGIERGSEWLYRGRRVRVLFCMPGARTTIVRLVTCPRSRPWSAPASEFLRKRREAP